jgi:hypothetical protein
MPLLLLLLSSRPKRGDVWPAEAHAMLQLVKWVKLAFRLKHSHAEMPIARCSAD